VTGYGPATDRPVDVKSGLTPVRRQRRRRYVDTKDFGAMVTRMIRAYGRRVANADMDDLTELVAMRALVDDAIATAVSHLRDHHEFSWAAIGDAVGTTRQAAQQRYGRKDHPTCTTTSSTSRPS
jgi:uncharacterized protein with PIN domain